MQQFLIIAAAHFLALLSPGPDFFLIARISLSEGWRVACRACLGIAMANGLFITAAFTGVAVMQPESALFTVLQWTGCAYLFYLGILFIRHAGGADLAHLPRSSPRRRSGSLAPGGGTSSGVMTMGFLSGILNPKNALFYASLAAMLSEPHTSTGWKAVYGTWMFCAVLLWDSLVAALIGNQAVRRRFTQALPWLERACGFILILLSAGILMFVM